MNALSKRAIFRLATRPNRPMSKAQASSASP